MEVTKATSTDGTIYRIYCEVLCGQNYYVIEYANTYNGSTMWYPVEEPTKLYNSLLDAQKALSYLLLPF